VATLETLNPSSSNQHRPKLVPTHAASPPQTARQRNTEGMLSAARVIRTLGWFARRRDLLDRNVSDTQIRAALADGTIFRVRHGWYSLPGAPEAAINAVRIGGRITGIAALELHGLAVPRRKVIDIVVPAGACRLRSPTDRARRLRESDNVTVHWTDPPRRHLDPNRWLASIDEALALVVATEPRDIAVACSSAVVNQRHWTNARLSRAFSRAPARARRWLGLVNGKDESHGETFVRVWLKDAGITCESQVSVDGVGRVDFRVSPNVYIEVDGAQHDPHWSGSSPSNWETDHVRDTAAAIRGGRVLRWTYRQIYGNWEACVEALLTARADDLELIARRRSRPGLPRGLTAATRLRRGRGRVARAIHPRDRRPRRRKVRGADIHDASRAG
jgi:very-short-patch-repair endonuclease